MVSIFVSDNLKLYRDLSCLGIYFIYNNINKVKVNDCVIL